MHYEEVNVCPECHSTNIKWYLSATKQCKDCKAIFKAQVLVEDEMDKNPYPKLQELQDEITLWAGNTFGKHRIAVPIVNHLKKEVDELLEALKDYYKGTYANKDDQSGMDVLSKKIERIKFEFADCLILILNASAVAGINVKQLVDSMEKKFEIVKGRQWGEPDENGVVEHVGKDKNKVEPQKKQLTEDVVRSMISMVYSEFAETSSRMQSGYRLKTIIQQEIEQHPTHPIKIFK